ncbi:ACI19 protein [Capsicum annuum]|nr:ACI19 protein [Capsicum annuum]
MEVVKNLNVERYMGRWYEIASFPSRFQPKDGVDTRATYSLNPDGTIHVLNETWSGGKRGYIEGTAYKADPNSDEAKLKVKFYVPPFLPIIPVTGDYWVLHIDPDYQYALIGQPSRNYLWFCAIELHFWRAICGILMLQSLPRLNLYLLCPLRSALVFSIFPIAPCFVVTPLASSGFHSSMPGKRGIQTMLGDVCSVPYASPPRPGTQGSCLPYVATLNTVFVPILEPTILHIPSHELIPHVAYFPRVPAAVLKGSLRILCRQPRLDDDTYNQLVEKAKEVGYDVSKLHKTPHSESPPEGDNAPTDSKGVWWLKSIFGR